MAINTGFYIEYLIRELKNINDKRETIPVYFNFGLIALIGVGFTFVGYLFLKDHANVNWSLFIVAASILLSIGFMMGAFIFVLPLSKALKSDTYKSISKLKTEAEKENLKVYGFGAVSPEMIWDFGDKIPQIKINDSSYNFPKEHKFGILANGFSPEETKNYTIIQHDTYDLNRSTPNTKSLKERLLKHYFVLTKK